MSALSDLKTMCERRTWHGSPPAYEFTKAELAPIRVLLINLDVDEDQETFLLEQITSREEKITVPKHIIDHIIEYLRGAT